MKNEYYGLHANEVRDILFARKKDGYTPGTQADGNKIALIFEGGAMNGLVSCAAGAQLQKLGFGNCFDHIYGTSSGAINAAYFTTGQSETAIRIYLEDIIGPHFMGAFRWPDQVDVNWLEKNVVAHGPHRLDLKRLQASPMKFRIPVTNTNTGECRFFCNHTDAPEFMVPAIKASGSTPMFVTYRTKIGDHFYNDGMMRAPVASEKAIADGATHVVALLCNPVGRRKRFKLFQALAEHFVRIRYYPKDYQTVFHSRAVFYNDAMDALHIGKQGVKTMVICPQMGEKSPKSLEKNLTVLNEVINNQRSRIEGIFTENSKSSSYRGVQKYDTYHT